MAVELLLFVSKRASAAVAALLCLAAIQLTVQAAGTPAPASASEVRVEISR